MAAALTIYNGQAASTGTTNLTFLTVADDTATKGTWEGGRIVTFKVRVLTGTIKFGVGGVHASALAVPNTAAELTFSCRNGNLACLQSNTGDTFLVTTVR